MQLIKPTKTIAEIANKKTIETQSSNYRFPVSLEPLYDQDGTETPFFSPKNKETGVFYKPVTERYKIHSYGEIIDLATEAMGNMGLDYKSSILTTCEGGVLRAKFTIPSVSQKIAELGDVVRLQFTLNGSYNGQVKSTICSGAEFLRCLNGACSTQRELEYAGKHSTELNVKKFKEIITITCEKFAETIGIYNIMAQKQISQKQGENILENLINPHFSERQAEKVKSLWNSPPSVGSKSQSIFGLYDQITYHLTHNVETGKFELANRIHTHLFSNLVKATKESDYLKELSLIPA